MARDGHNLLPYMKFKTESDIEKAVCEYAETLGCVQYKFVSPNTRAVPDRIFLYSGHALFIEFKHPDKPCEFTRLQQIQRDLISGTGHPVFVVNDVSIGCNIINQFILLHPII